MIQAVRFKMLCLYWVVGFLFAFDSCRCEAHQAPLLSELVMAEVFRDEGRDRLVEASPASYLSLACAQVKMLTRSRPECSETAPVCVSVVFG